MRLLWIRIVHTVSLRINGRLIDTDSLLRYKKRSGLLRFQGRKALFVRDETRVERKGLRVAFKAFARLCSRSLVDGVDWLRRGQKAESGGGEPERWKVRRGLTKLAGTTSSDFGP